MKHKLYNNLTFLILFAFVLAGIVDVTNPGHSLLSLGAPFLLALVSFVFGLYRFRIRKPDSLILIALNLVFLILTFNTKIYLLNIFILSLLVWSLIAPVIARFRATLAVTVIIPVVLAFAVPYYKLPYPLLPLLYLPVFIFGYTFEGLRLKRTRMTAIYSLVGILGSLALLYNTFHRSLKLTVPYGKVYIQSIFANSAAFVFAPIITVAFLLLVFSILILATGMTDFIAHKIKNTVNWRAAFLSATVLLPFLAGTVALAPGRTVRLCLIPALATVYVALYFIAVRIISRPQASRTSASGRPSASASEVSATAESLPERDVDINRQLFHVLFAIGYVLAAVLSIEFIIRSNDVHLTIGYTSSPSFAYNLLFVGVLYLLATSVLGRKPGTLLAVLVHIVLLLANYLKLTFFSEPFFPWDVGLISTAAQISGDYVNIYTIAIVAVVLLAIIILIVKYFSKVLKFIRPRPNISFAVVMAAMLVFNLHLLSVGGLQSINIFKGWYDGVNEYEKNGTYVENVLYLQHIKQYVNSKPANYSADTVKQLEKKLEAQGTGENSDLKPDVIVILGETFWDPENMNVSFNEEIAPNLKQYQTGTMVSPAFGGGTANVEFEVLTGFSNFFFNTSIIPYNVYFKHSVPSIVSAFKSNGYNAVAVHPNDGSFYNRSNVYKYMGFDEFKDIKSFDPSTQTKGNYVADSVLVDKISDTLKEEDGPAFVLGITMQNHDPYTPDVKNYGTYQEIQVNSGILNDDEKNVLSTFAQGVHDEDKALAQLIDVAKKNDRPTLIYMYGDHLPRLGVGLPGGNYEIYEKLGYTDGQTDPRTDEKFYETPYVAWSSYKDIPKNDTPVSPAQLSLDILKNAGIKYPAYFNSLLDLKTEHPYLSGYLDSRQLLQSDKTVQEYYMMQYDLMFGNQYLAKN